MSRTLDRERKVDTEKRGRSEKAADASALAAEGAATLTQPEGGAPFLEAASTKASPASEQRAAYPPARRRGRMLLLLLLALFAYAGITRPELWRLQAWLTQMALGWKNSYSSQQDWLTSTIPHPIRFVRVGGLFEAPEPSAAAACPPPMLRPLSITPPLSLVTTRDFVVMAERAPESSHKEPPYPSPLLNAERQTATAATLRALQLMDAATGSAAKLAAAASPQTPNLSENTAPNE